MNKVIAASDGQRDHPALFILQGRDRFYGIGQEITKERVYIRGVHVTKELTIRHTGELNIVAAAIQRFFSEDRIKGVVVGGNFRIEGLKEFVRLLLKGSHLQPETVKSATRQLMKQELYLRMSQEKESYFLRIKEFFL